MQKKLRDERLVLAKIASGDQQAFANLFNFYRNKVYGYAYAILQTATPAEEIVQDIFIKLWIQRENLVNIENFGGFLRTSVKNETLNALKKIASAHKTYQIANLSATEIDFTTENTIQFHETQKILNAAIEKLPAQQKLVYNLCKIEGFKQKDVADQLNISPSTVKTHLRDAVKAIKSYLVTYDEVKVVPLLLFFLK